MGRVRVTAGTVTDGEWKEGRGRFAAYLSAGQVFPCGGYLELEEADLNDEQRADPCLRILEVEDAPSLEEVAPPVVQDESPVVMVEADAPPVLEEAKSKKKSAPAVEVVEVAADDSAKAKDK